MAAARRGVVGALPGSAYLQNLLEERWSEGRLARVTVGQGEVVHGDERFRVIDPAFRLLKRQSLLKERQGQVRFAGLEVGVGQVVHPDERIGMVGAQLRISGA